MKNDQVTVCIDSLLSLHRQERETKKENAERQWRISVSVNIQTLQAPSDCLVLCWQVKWRRGSLQRDETKK